MSTAKVEFRIGEIHFLGEGDEAWVTKQLSFVIEKAPTLIQLVPKQENTHNTENSANPQNGGTEISTKPLATFLKERNATVNQTGKFLATAIWLHDKGNKRLETSSIAKALRESNQSKINNPSECLNQNVKKGFCEKDGKSFFVTDEGRKEILG